MTAFDDYINRHGNKLFSLCLKLCRNSWDAQDLYQSTWLKAYRNFGRYDHSREFDSWVAKICVNLYRDQLRRKKIISFISFKTQEEQDNTLANIQAPGESDNSFVKEVVSGLPEKYKQVVILYYFHDKSVKQTAETLEIPEGTVKSRLDTGRRMLKEGLKKYE